MADEVPVCDVLCEAMEYLSKLGSNLRTRSDNLREKKIRKDRLRNTHAVHKAASKVLLICELSKKSLENVETGVRKVLSLIDKSQEHVGGKKYNRQNDDSKRYHYFEYNSQKLRIVKKVSIKHYMSVKVRANSLSAALQEKYPVYYDCKLFRQRRSALEKIEPQNCRRISLVSHTDDNENDKGNDSDSKRSNCTVNTLKDDLKSNSLDQTNVTPDINDKIVGKHSGDNMVSESEANEKSQKSKESKRKRETCIENSDEDSNLHKTKSRKTSHDQISSEEEGKKIEHQKAKSKKVFIIDDSSESENESQTEANTKSVQKKFSIKTIESNEKDSSDGMPKTKKVKFAGSDDESIKNSDDSEQKISEENPKPLIRCVSLNKLLKPNALFSKINVNSSKQENKTKSGPKLQTKKVKHQRSSVDDEFWVKKRNEVKEFKPKTFSIKVERLPDLSVNFLQRHQLNKIIQCGKIVCEVPRIDENVIVKNVLLNDSESDENQNDEGKAADSDQIKIIPNDPDLKKSDKDKDYLRNDQKSTVLKKKKPKTKKAIIVDSDSDKDEKEKQHASKVNEVILNDPDIDKSGTEKVDKPDATKQALLCDSDSNSNDNANPNLKKSTQITKSREKVSEAIKESLLNDSDSDGNENVEQNSESEKTEEIQSNKCDASNAIKESLLNSSDSDKTHNSESKKTKPDEENEVMTSDIKESLLNDSDSDRNDSQDSVLKETRKISKMKQNECDATKQSLLNDSDSDNGSGKQQLNTNNQKEKQDTNEFDSNNEQDEIEKEMADKIKNALLYDSDESDHEKQLSQDNNDRKDGSENEPKQVEEQLNVQEKGAQSDCNEKDNSKEDSSQNKDPDKIKNSLLNDLSSNDSDDSVKIKKKQKVKLSRSKRTQAKKAIYTSSSSDDETEKVNSNETLKKHGRKCERKSSSSNEDTKCMRSQESSQSKNEEDSDSKTSNKVEQGNGSIAQMDGTLDEDSNSSVQKMVRSKAKPSGSSSQNDDASDKDIDRLTNLNNIPKIHRRREPSKNSKNSPLRKSSRSKPTPTIGVNLLSAETSSDASDDINEVEEDLPPVKLSGLNGDGIEHLAKDDLLGASDSSVSRKENSEDNQTTNDSDEEESVKLRRRKANAISSDSDGGTSRRKKDERVSDFEDTEDESSEPMKKSKRKKQASDSDASVGSTDDSNNKKKRRRIKQLDSDGSGSDDTENEGRNKHGRKNIRKVMGKNQLEEATKKAAREEKERIARITERQKLYNNLEFDESGKPDEVVLEKVVLDFDPETKEPLIQVDRGLVKKLKPHQANGIKFMWDACFESAKRIKKDKGSGCILAHCMGLGKTLQVISLTHTLLTHSSLTGVNRVLVVCPLSTVLNWVNEFKMWLKHAEKDRDVDVYELSRYKQNSERAFQLQQWFDHGGVCVLGYEMFRNLSADNNKKYKKKMLRSFQDSLVDPGPDMVVCDEGHLLKNEKTSLSQSMNKVKTLRRIVLTGTPLQNNLKEYYCMVQFVKPNLLGKYNEYLNRFVNPITNGQYTDSTEQDIRVMKRRSHVLHKMLDGAVQRRDYGVLAPFLPPKHEYVLFITLTDVQIKLYQHYLDNYSRRPLPGKSSGFLFPDFQSLQRIWTHPLVLKYNSERYEIMQQKKREREEEDSEGSLVDFIDDDSTPDESSTEESTDDSSDMSDDSRKKSKKKKAAKKNKAKDSKGGGRRNTRANPVEIDDDHPVEVIEEVKNENPTEWWIRLVEEEELDDLRNSHKLVLLFDILRQCEAIGDKLLVFSQSLYSLDLIEHFLGKVDEATQEGRIDEKLGGHVGSWSPGVDYFRLDGSTSCENRSIWCKNFNREDNPRARLFLISTRAGGLGINLVAANRVVIFDVSWNPSHDVQSIFRVYRFGQKKPCYVYRFLAMGTMEEKIYERQVTKQAISKRVIDEQQIDRHYAENDLAELYKFEARPEAPRELPPLPKDRLFAEMLREHEAQIYKYHEHDSLLENKEEETLSEEERKAAWEDFENEKTRPPPAPFPSPWPMHNGMVPGLLAQQQQLAFAALAAMLRKDMPNINDNQIRDMLPLIYNSNPGLMQKMGEIYKYAQPGMMNPGMMNTMNPGTGGGMGTSGLQYEPPWQRQQHQQQQMRLQQILQGQTQMAAQQAKFYAGGLGSRDPVAMALQQQRAREIMMSGGAGAGAAAGAGRPRGRPPLQPRAPPAPSQDVVNLDSD